VGNLTEGLIRKVKEGEEMKKYALLLSHGKYQTIAKFYDM
jgi:hypothetical protein